MIHPLFRQLGLMMQNRVISGSSRRSAYLLKCCNAFVDSFPVTETTDRENVLPLPRGDD